MDRTRPILISLLVLLLFGAAPVIACSCFMVPNPPCRAAGSADAIFEGEVLEREKIATENEDYTRRRFTMKVRKTYKGSLGEAVFVYTGNGDSDCGYRFKIGERYLVYAYENNGRLYTGICTRTSRIKYAKEDLDYFSRLPGVPSGATITGRVRKPNTEKLGSLPFIGFPYVRIKIDGPEQKSVETDADGNFSVVGLVPGEYEVKAELPAGFVLSFASRVDLYPYPLYIERIVDKGCLEVDLVFAPTKSP